MIKKEVLPQKEALTEAIPLILDAKNEKELLRAYHDAGIIY